jgi:penicillin-binding protein 2
MLTPARFEDRRSLQVRLIVLRVLAVVCFAALAVGFWIVQIVQHEKYAEMAENNNRRTIPLRAPRGVLFDRDGRVLVNNADSFTIAVAREQSKTPKDLAGVSQRLAAALGVDERIIRTALQRRWSDGSFRPIPVIEHATFEQVAAVSARKLELPEVVIQEVPTRAYPDGGLAAHLFGYVSEIQPSQLGRAEFAGLQLGAWVGQTGVENTYNDVLMGQDGSRNVIIDQQQREREELQRDDPKDGDRLQLTIDLDLQRALEDAFKANGFSGAGVFMDPKTGEILAMTSQPEYDPNDFANGIDRAKMGELTTDALKPLMNRLIQGRYSPGSVFKILMATAGLAEGVITPETTFYCPGEATFYGQVFHCDKKDGHGTLDLRHAIEQSCNVYFFNVANRLKIDQIHDWAQKLGLVGKTGIDLPGEVESIVPSTEWARQTRKDPKWYPSETISVGIGQGPVTLTPIALATMMATVANGGTVVTPHVAKAVDKGSGWEALPPPAPKSFFALPPEVIDPVRDGLWMVVNGEGGTASRARVAGHDVVGKTGTAQVISREGAKAAQGKTDENLKDNAWFVFYAPKDNPQIAGVVFAEHEGHGGAASAPIVRYVLETFFAKQEHRPAPKFRIDADGTFTIITNPPPSPASGKGGGE